MSGWLCAALCNRATVMICSAVAGISEHMSGWRPDLMPACSGSCDPESCQHVKARAWQGCMPNVVIRKYRVGSDGRQPVWLVAWLAHTACILCSTLSERHLLRDTDTAASPCRMRQASSRLGCDQPCTSYAQSPASHRPCLRAAGPASAPQRRLPVATQAATFVGGQQAGGLGITEYVWVLSLGAAAIWLGKSLFEQVSGHSCLAPAACPVVAAS